MKKIFLLLFMLCISACSTNSAKENASIVDDKEFSITWENWDGSILLVSTVSYGEIPEYTVITDDNKRITAGTLCDSTGFRLYEYEKGCPARGQPERRFPVLFVCT